MYAAVRVQWDEHAGDFIFDRVICIKRTVDECLADAALLCTEHGLTPVFGQGNMTEEEWDKVWDNSNGAPTIFYVHDEHGKEAGICYGFKFPARDLASAQ